MSNGHLKPSADRQSLGLTQVPRQVNLAVENQRIGLREDQQETIVLIPSTTVLNWLVVYHGIPTPLKNMSSSVGMILPNIWKNMFQTTNQYMMCTITTFNYSNARGTSCHNPPWESLWIKQETLNQQMFLLVGWLCITATLPISKNGEEIWGINNSNCELTIQVNMEDVTQLTMEAIQLWLELLQPFTRLFPGLGTWERNAVEVPSMPTSKHQRLYLSYMVETSGSTIGL